MRNRARHLGVSQEELALAVYSVGSLMLRGSERKGKAKRDRQRTVQQCVLKPRCFLCTSLGFQARETRQSLQEPQNETIEAKMAGLLGLNYKLIIVKA